MILSAWLFVGLVAVLVTGVAVTTSDNGIAIVSGTLGFILWGVFAFGAYDVTVVTDSAVRQQTMPFVALVGVMMAIVPAFVALTGPIEIIQRYRRGSPDDL